jgi:tetratricopeptide (TPR) repeat protein
MHVNRLLPGLVCAVLLSACATANQPAPAKPVPTLAAVLTDAETAQKAGQNGRALMLLKEATEAWPAEKMPWLRMAQLRFETNSYGEAILSAQEALERDPDESVANSIIAVSSLRLASRALADLSRRNNLNGSTKSEAQELAKLLREALSTKDLTHAPRPPAKVPRESRNNGAPAPKSSTSNDPFVHVR